MILFRGLGRIRHPDQSIEYYREWTDRGNRLHEFTFATIESLAIVAALFAGATKTGSILLWTFYWISYFVVMFYFHNNFRYFFHAIADRFGIMVDNRPTLLWLSTLLSVALSAVLPTVTSYLVSDMMTAGVF